MSQEASSDWDDYLAAFALGVGIKHPSLCDSAFISQKIFGFRMPRDFKYYGRGGIRSDMLCRDLALLRFANRETNDKKLRSRYKRAFKVGKLFSKYDSKKLQSVALYLWNGYKGAGDLTPDEVEASKAIIEELQAKRASLSL